LNEISVSVSDPVFAGMYWAPRFDDAVLVVDFGMTMLSETCCVIDGALVDPPEGALVLVPVEVGPGACVGRLAPIEGVVDAPPPPPPQAASAAPTNTKSRQRSLKRMDRHLH